MVQAPTSSDGFLSTVSAHWAPAASPPAAPPEASQLLLVINNCVLDMFVHIYILLKLQACEVTKRAS